MFIRTQSRDVLVNLSRVDNIVIRGNFIFAVTADVEIMLGKYKSKEKCLEILSRIETYIRNPNNIIDNGLYKMPEE